MSQTRRRELSFVSPRLHAVAELKRSSCRRPGPCRACVSTAQRRGRIEARRDRDGGRRRSRVSPRLNAVAELKLSRKGGTWSRTLRVSTAQRRGRIEAACGRKLGRKPLRG